MLTRTTHPNGIVTYQSPRLTALAVPHAFSTRIGGISPPPFDSLNLGNPTGCDVQDDNAHLQENYNRLTATLPPLPNGTPRLRAWVKQVHGLRIELIEPEPQTDYSETLDAEIRDRYHGQLEADGILTTCPRVLLTVRVADCVPILLSSPDGSAVAAVHAGWRGVVNGILPRAIRAFTELGVKPADLIAAIGPHISAPHFEVGPEVAADFTRTGLSDAIIPPAGEGKPHINLQRALLLQLTAQGVTQVDTTSACTYANHEDFYSHRRDQGRTGRQAALIAPKP